MLIPAMDLSPMLAPLFGGSLIGMAYYMSILGLINSTSVSSQLIPYYTRYNNTSHGNFFSSPCSNYTELYVTDVISNLTYVAPNKNMYAFHYEPELGYFIITFTNDDTQTNQIGDFNKLSQWYVSDFPIDKPQQQFADSYMSMDFPVFVKLIPD